MPPRLIEHDPEVHAAIRSEIQRQNDDLELIASENYVSEAVLEALGSPLTNKYAEGLPGARYYGGCEFVDQVENLARKRARTLFMVEGCDIGVNVQPHSGAQANQAIYLCTLQPGEVFLGLDLSHGGHLTHGSPVNSSGKLYKPVHYHVGSDGRIDMDEVRDQAKKNKPKLIMTGASAYPRIIDFKSFRQIADEVGAVLVADIAHIAGLVATGIHPSPFPHCHYVSTTTHKTLRGPRGGMVMAQKELMKGLNSAVFPGTQGGPLMHVIAAKAVAFGEALEPEFHQYSVRVVENAQAMASTLLERGYSLVSGGTDNHLMLVDLSNKEITGKEGEDALGRAGITVNKNTVPGEKRSPMITSGIRIGTPAMTSRGVTVDEAMTIAGWIADVLDAPTNAARIEEVRSLVRVLCQQYPMYPEAWVGEER